MVEVEFNCQQIITIIQANCTDSFNSIINKFIVKTQLDINNLHFLSKGKGNQNNELIENIMSESDKQKKKY